MGYIRRVKEKTKNFTIVCNEVYRDKLLSAKAKGIHIYLMTLPDDWKIRKAELITHFKDGKKSFDAGFKELEKRGYIHKKRLKNAKGQFTGWEYLVYESSTEIPKTESPFYGKSEKGELLNTKNILSTNNTNQDTKVSLDVPKETSLIFEEWNKLDCSTNHKLNPDSKLFKTVDSYVNNLLNGKPLLQNKNGKISKWFQKFIDRFNLNKEIIYKKWTIEEIIEVIKLNKNYSNLSQFFFQNKPYEYSNFYILHLQKNIPSIYLRTSSLFLSILDKPINDSLLGITAFDIQNRLPKKFDITKVYKLLKWYKEVDGKNQKYISTFYNLPQFLDKLDRLFANKEQFEKKTQSELGTGISEKQPDWMKFLDSKGD